MPDRAQRQNNGNDFMVVCFPRCVSDERFTIEGRGVRVLAHRSDSLDARGGPFLSSVACLAANGQRLSHPSGDVLDR